MNRLFKLWFWLVSVCLLVWLGQAQVPEPAECLVSGIYNLTRLPVEGEDEGKCWRDCDAEPDCHMALIVIPLSGKKQCLLVNCLNKIRYSYARHPSTEIRVYPKSTIDDDQRYYFMTDAYGLADETLHCSDFMNCSSCQSGVPRFFYNRTSYRCERFHAGCGSNRNSFETQEGCEALCNKKFRCYRPMQYGAGSANISMFFYNMTSQSCERFNFSGHGSNGNIFQTEEECENLCGDIKATTTSRPAVTTATTTSRPAVTTGTTVAVPTEKTSTTTRRPAVTKAPTTRRPAVTKAPTTRRPAVTKAPTTRPPALPTEVVVIIVVTVVIIVIILIVVIIACISCARDDHRHRSSARYQRVTSSEDGNQSSVLRAHNLEKKVSLGISSYQILTPSDDGNQSMMELDSVSVNLETDEDFSSGVDESIMVQRTVSSGDGGKGLNKKRRRRGFQRKQKKHILP